MESKTIGRKAIVVAFLAVPIIASVISTFHLVHLFLLGNPDIMSYLLSIAFEVGSVAAFAALAVLDKLKRGMVIFIFSVLFFMQLIGNVYYSFEYVNIKLAESASWLASFTEFLTPLLGKLAPSTYKFILAIIIGVPIPLVSIAFVKSLVDYLQVDSGIKPEGFPVSVDKDKAEDSLAKTMTQYKEELPTFKEPTDKRKPLWPEPFPALELKKKPTSKDEGDAALIANPFE